MQPRFPFVAVDVPSDRAEQLVLVLFEMGAGGVEVRDEQTRAVDEAILALPDPWGQGEHARPAGSVTLLASFEERAAAERALEAVTALLPESDCRYGELVGDGWRDKYREYFAPFAITRTVMVVPPWVDASAAPGTDERVVVLDPGRAFGTGLHETTALVADYLEQHAESLSGRAVLDVGTGSGILALVGLRLGASRAVAIDSDPDAVAVARENAQRNGLGDRLELQHTTVEHVSGTFDWVVANIEASALCNMAEPLCRRVARGGSLVLSGILERDREAVLREYGRQSAAHGLGLKHAATQRRGEGDSSWIALAFVRPAVEAGSGPGASKAE